MSAQDLRILVIPLSPGAPDTTVTTTLTASMQQERLPGGVRIAVQTVPPADFADALRRDTGKTIAAVVYVETPDGPPAQADALIGLQHELLRVASRIEMFTVVWGERCSRDAATRLDLVDVASIRMVTHVQADFLKALSQVARSHPLSSRGQPTARCKCPYCGLNGMTPDQLWYHAALFHINDPNKAGVPCPICGGDTGGAYVVHVHDVHPPADQAHHSVGRPTIHLYAFALCVVRRKSDGKFLLVQEYCNQGYWLPGGGIDAGEDPVTAALREAIEEVGVRLRLTGILRIEVSSKMSRRVGTPGTARIRYLFAAEPEDEADCEPKTLPDFESAGACWVSVEDILENRVRLRSQEPLQWCPYVARGGFVAPMTMLAPEGSDPPAC